MDSKVRCEQGVYIVNLSGQILLENIDEFKRICVEHLLDKHIIFNITQLSFVGSTGITTFLESIRRLYNTKDKKVKMVGVSSEFEKIFTTNLVNMIEYFENEKQAFISIFHPERAIYQNRALSANAQGQGNYSAVQGMGGAQFQQDHRVDQSAQAYGPAYQQSNQVQVNNASQSTYAPNYQRTNPGPVVTQVDQLCDVISLRIRERQLLEAEGLAYIVNEVAFNNNDRIFKDDSRSFKVNRVATEATT